MFDLEKFARFLIAQQNDHSPVTFSRVAEEVVCLAFDLNTQSLVELHVLNNSEDLSSAARESFEERTRTAMELCGPCFCQIIDVGEFEKMRYYATAVNDGEFLKDYVARVAPVDVPQALSLVIHLCDAVAEVQRHARLLNGLRLANLLVCRIDDSHIALRMLDLGLARPENLASAEETLAKKMAELSQILFFLLSGNRYAGNDPAQVNSLAGLPANLKVLLRQTLDAGATPVQGAGPRPERLEKYRSELADSYGAVSQRITRSTAFRPLEAPARLHPKSMLTAKFFGDLDLEEQLGDRYRIVETPEMSLSPYARLVEDLQKDRETIVQFLPAGRTLPMEHSALVIQEMSRIKEADHPNLIRCRGFWETDRLACIAEEPHNGFSLSLLLAERGGLLETPETLILLRQLDKAIRQAASIDLLPQALSIHSLEVHFPNESRFRVRELRKRHVDFWPEFLLKLRCHATLESVVSMPPSGRMRVSGEPTPEWLTKMDFVGVAEFLVIGAMPPPSPLQGVGEPEDERVEALRSFFHKQYSKLGEDVTGFDSASFVDALETKLSQTRPEAEIEVMGTIVDGAIAFSDAKAASPAVIREGGGAGRSSAGPPRPMGGFDNEPGEAAQPTGMNPIAQRMREGAGNAPAAEAESLGTIDDLEFDIGDSREKPAAVPIPLGTIGGSEGLPGNELPEANTEVDTEADEKKTGKRKGWFFLK